MSVKILVVDNYDSFVYTLVGYLQQLGAQTTVVRNDDLDVAAATALAGEHQGVLLSPGPGAPADAGVCADLIRWAEHTRTPLLGVCLGHQALGEVYGARVGHAQQLMHGKTSQLVHHGDSVFPSVPSPFTATRYHSLAIESDTVPDELIVTGRTENGIVMAVRHRELPLHGVQFHPESVLTEGGHRMLANWLGVCGDADAVQRSVGLAPLVH